MAEKTPKVVDSENVAFNMNEAPKFDAKPLDDMDSRLSKLSADIPYGEAIEELKKLELKLPLDPVKEGMTKMHGLLSEVQDRQDRCKAFLMRAIWTRARLESLQSEVEALNDARSAQCKMTMPSIQSLRNISLQDAAVSMVLDRERRLVTECSRRVEQIKAFHQMCQVEYDNLQATDRNISRQIKVVVIQVEIGEIKSVSGAQAGARARFGNDD
jgi:hypothetical protein